MDEITARKTDSIVLPIGTNEKGKVYEDFSLLSHVLISGTTGSGKTSFVLSLLTEMIEQFKPEDVRLILCDSRMVEYTKFNGIQHLLVPVITKAYGTNGVINWLINEAKDKLSGNNTENNKYHTFLVLDDCAELLKQSDVQEDLRELLYIARSADIHCWLITSTPSSTIFPMNILANVPGRIAFHTASKSVSRSIIGENGAEYLAMPGEMLYKNPIEIIKCNALYAPYEILNKRIECIIKEERIKSQGKNWAEKVKEALDEVKIVKTESYQGCDKDEFLPEAGRYIITTGKASIGWLQRYFRIGFNRASKIMDQLAEIGLVGPEEGTHPRQILLTSEEFENAIKNL